MHNNTTQQKSFLIKDTTSNILKPITDQVTYKLLTYIGALNFFKDDRTYNIYYHDEVSALSKLRDDDYKAKVTHNRVDIIAEPIVNPKEIKNPIFTFDNDFVFGNDRLTVTDMFPIFEDAPHSIKLLEYNVPGAIKLDFNLKVKSSEVKDIIMASLYSKFSLSKINKYHDLIFQYELPTYMLVMLYKLYNMRKTPEGVSFRDYIKYGSENIISVNHDKTQMDQIQLYINKMNLMCLGSIDFGLENPEEDKINKVIDRFGIKFSYVIQFSRPHILQLNYPLLIKNKYIPDELRNDDKLNDTLSDSAVASENLTMTYRHMFKTFNRAYYSNASKKTNFAKKYKTIRYPREDNLIPKRSPLDMNNLIIFQGILEVETTIGGNTFIQVDLKNEIFPLIQDHHDVAALEDIIKIEEDDCKSSNSLVSIMIFNNDNIIAKSSFSISDELIIFCEDMDINSTYRIVISLRTSFLRMSKGQIYKALQYYSYFSGLIIANLEKLIADKYITVEYLTGQYLLDEEAMARLRALYGTEVNENLYLLSGKTLTVNKVFYGTEVKGGNTYGAYPGFRIENVIIYPRAVR